MALGVKKLPSLSNVAAGADATLECPLGPTYTKITVSASGTGLTAAHIGKIEVRINGKVVMEFRDLQRLIDLNSYYGRPADSANQFTIYFDRPEASDLPFKRLAGIGTQDIQTFDVRISIDAAAPSDLTMEAWAEVREPMTLGPVVKVREFPFSSSVAGEVDIDKIPRGPRIVAIHLFKSDVNNVVLEADSVKVIDASKTVLETLQKQAVPRARVPLTSKATHVDFVLEGDFAQALVTKALRDMRLKTTLGTSGSMDIVVEYLDQAASV